MIQPYQLCNNRWEESVNYNKTLDISMPMTDPFWTFCIYLLTHKHQPFMDREIHHSHGFYGILVTPKPPFPTSGPPRNGKLQGFSCSVAVHEGIVLFPGHIDRSHRISDCWDPPKGVFQNPGNTQGSTLDLQFPPVT